MEKRPNFYTLLDLDPSVTDWPKIESAILAKRRAWALHKNQGTPAQRRRAERYLKFIPDMESLLKDAESRKLELKAFKQEEKRKKQEQLKQLDELIENIYSQSASPELIESLIQQTGKAFSVKDVEKRLKQKGIAIDKDLPPKAKRPTQPKLDASVAKGIRDELNTLHLKSLYDFLNLDYSPKLGRRSSPKSLYNRADTIYKDLSRVGKTDADITLKMHLAGRAKSVFANSTEKDRYDNTYASEALIDLDKHLEIAGHDRFLETKEIESLLKRGKRLGVVEWVAMEYIEDYATKRKWGIQRAAEPVTIAWKICGYCDTLATSLSDNRCKTCGEELTQPCPNCGSPTPTENSACSKCGCHTGDAPLVKSLLREGKRFNNEGEYDKAISRLNRALHYWGDWAPAIKEKKRAETKKQESYKELQNIKVMIKERKMESAESRLEQFKHKFGSSNTTSISHQISVGLNKAKAAFDSAENLRTAGHSEQAYDKYEVSLSFSTDFSPSIAAMAGSHPPAPTNVSASWIGNTLRFTWPTVKASGKLSYVVVRKKDGVPSNRNDGDLIAETTIAQADDSDINPGIIFYYAIFSIRAKTTSKTFATSGPYLLVTDVSHIEYQSGDRQVSIKWRPPPGSSLVEVWRREGLAPTRRGEGKKISVSGNTVLDPGLENERRYGYLIIARYCHPEDTSRAIYSKGIRILATPVAPPDPINDLMAQRIDHTVFLSWTPITGKAHVQIRQTQSMPSFTSGQIISINDAGRFGDPIPTTTTGQTQTTLKTQGRVYFVPLTIIAETAVVGDPVTITTLDDVTNLRSMQNGNSIILSWQWPLGATEVLVTYQHYRFPASPEESSAAKERITRTEYERNNHWELRSTERKKHYFTVFCKDPAANIYSSGINLLEAMGQETTINYQVVVRKNIITRRSREAWVELNTEGNMSLEGVLVVLKQKFPPVSKDDGLIIASVDQLTFMEGVSRIEIPKSYLNSKGYIKLFFDDNKAVKEIRLLPSRKEKLRLN